MAGRVWLRAPQGISPVDPIQRELRGLVDRAGRHYPVRVP